jgi:hypothetical protein
MEVFFKVCLVFSSSVSLSGSLCFPDREAVTQHLTLTFTSVGTEDVKKLILQLRELIKKILPDSK